MLRTSDAEKDARAVGIAEQIRALFKELDALDYEVSRCSGDHCNGHSSAFGSKLASELAEGYGWELN